MTRNNLWGITHSISLRTRVSTLEDLALLNYSWPHFARRDNLTVSFTALFDDSRDIRTFNYRREELSAQLNQRLTKSITMFYRFAYRVVGVSDLKITPFLIPLLSQPVRVGIGSLNFVQDRRDDALDPHKGLYNTLDLGLAEGAFGSQRNFLRLLARNATYHQLGQAAGAGAQHRIRRHLRLQLERQPARCHPAARAFLQRRRRTPTAAFPNTRPARATPPPVFRWAARRYSSTRRSCAFR